MAFAAKWGIFIPKPNRRLKFRCRKEKTAVSLQTLRFSVWWS